MLNYITKLKKQYEDVKNKINIENNGYKLIDLDNELLVIENRINYCIDLVINNYHYDELLEYAKKIFHSELINKALEDADKYNQTITDDNKKRLFVDYLSSEEKESLANKLLENLSVGKKTSEELLNKAIGYKDKYDFLVNAKYPVLDRFKELTENDNSLSKYLLENEENINRLTVISSNDIIVNVFTNKVSKIEYQHSKRRYASFNKAAKEKGVHDLIDNIGQFRKKKVYYNSENYERFRNCIQEVKSSNDTKDKIKKLLKKFNSLQILDENANAGESPYKEYGFIRFINAKEAFVNAMNETPANEEKIKNSLECLKNEEAKINEMYNMIQEELGDSYETMPSNVDSYRNVYVPPCFKNNLSINAKFNSLYIMSTFIKEKNLDIDEFVEKPLELSGRCFEEYYQKSNIDNLLKDKTKGEAILFLTNPKLPKKEDQFKYTRCFELINKSETNEQFAKENNLSMIGSTTHFGDIALAIDMGDNYFLNYPLESIQNIFMAKKNNDSQISYLDCYVSASPIQEEPKTNLAYDEKQTIVEKINEDKDIVNTFYEAVDTLKYIIANRSKLNRKNLSVSQVFSSLQLLATKIFVTLDINGPSKPKVDYPESFVEDLSNIILDYKKIEGLKDYPFKIDENNVTAMTHVINNRDTLIQIYEKNMVKGQHEKENVFIMEFERINKEIDDLDKQADKISKKLKKGATNQEIEDIALEQRKKFIELQELQNSRLKELKRDVMNGKISRFYFEQRAEQVKMLSNIKDKPAMFMCDDKKYKNFKTYVKEILKINLKTLDNSKIVEEKNKYDLLMAKSKEDKKFYIINNILKDNRLSISKSINYEKIEDIVIDNNIEQRKELSSELLNQKTKEEIENESLNKATIVVDLHDQEKLVNYDLNNEIIKNIESVKKV